jgi:heterodisulfide reductase subunit B
MTPRKKANELISQYLHAVIDLPYTDSSDGECIGTGHMTYFSAVKCAIITVNQILIAREINSKFILDRKYWEEVLQELEKR